MSDDGQNIMRMVTQMRELCQQIGLVLGTADGLVAEEGWTQPEEKKEKSVTSGNSASLDWPRFWFPEHFYRFYTNAKRPNVLLYLAVVLDNREGKPEYAPEGGEFSEPVVTSGYYVFEGDSIGQWDYHWCLGHFWSSDPDYKGGVYERVPSGQNPKEGVFQVLRSLALPLTVISNSEALKEKVTQPIAEDMLGYLGALTGQS